MAGNAMIYSTVASRSLGVEEHQVDSAFALTYILRLRSCSFVGGLIISPLPHVLTKEPRAAGSLCSTGVTPLHGSYGPSRHRLVFDQISTRFRRIGGPKSPIPA
jgi:hypothetical protein